MTARLEASPGAGGGPPSPSPRPAAAAAAAELAPAGREGSLLEMWFALARLAWSSVVLVPASEDGSTRELAEGLAAVGRRVRNIPVTVLWAAHLDFETASSLGATIGRGPAAIGADGGHVGQLVVSVPPVVVEPLGAAVTQAADATILCVELGRSRLRSIRRAVELIGRERVAGCFLLDPRGR